MHTYEKFRKRTPVGVSQHLSTPHARVVFRRGTSCLVPRQNCLRFLPNHSVQNKQTVRIAWPRGNQEFQECASPQFWSLPHSSLKQDSSAITLETQVWASDCSFRQLDFSNTFLYYVPFVFSKQNTGSQTSRKCLSCVISQSKAKNQQATKQEHRELLIIVLSDQAIHSKQMYRYSRHLKNKRL